jgi:hypothetical protein
MGKQTNFKKLFYIVLHKCVEKVLGCLSLLSVAYKFPVIIQIL